MSNNSQKTGFNRKKLVIWITVVSVFASLIPTILVLILLNRSLDPWNLMMAVLLPALIAPSASWYITGLMAEMDRLKGEMQKMATYDSLTGVMVRGAFVSSSSQICKLANRNAKQVSVLFIDIDNFKQINDSFGHGGGDEVLKSFGNIIRQCLRNSDLAGRMGGEEFVLTLPETNMQGALHIAGKISEMVRECEVTTDNGMVNYSISVGVASQEAEANFEQLLSQADDAMYQAKYAGKDQVVTYSDQIS
ncbi:MAG: GGDEF domain-containing protein [Gallionella sp.]|jgi:diguanylate cyclase (GGDEF)-like protein